MSRNLIALIQITAAGFTLALLFSNSFAVELVESSYGEPDHLVPDRSVYAYPTLMEYSLTVSKLLPPKKFEMIRVLVLPSFAPEYAISIQKNKKAYVLEVREPEKSYSGLEFRKYEAKQSGEEYPISTYADISVKSCSKSINDTLVSSLMTVLQRELFRVRHAKKIHGGFDGTTYHYSARHKGGQMMSGQTWSPSLNLPTGQLVVISNSLYEYCFNSITDEKIIKAIEEAR